MDEQDSKQQGENVYNEGVREKELVGWK